MIEGVSIRRFRGLRQLDVQGFGRVNLIIGKNDCGKTALMEALWLSSDEDVADYFVSAQESRITNGDPSNFDRFWLPLFWNQSVDQGLTIDTRWLGQRPPLTIELRKADVPNVRTKHPSGKPRAEQRRPRAGWALELTTSSGGETKTGTIVSSGTDVSLPPSEMRAHTAWIEASRNITVTDIGLFSKLKQTGRDDLLVEVLKMIDPQISGVELLAPNGGDAEVYVRLEPGKLLLPISMMGEGFQRSFELGVASVSPELESAFVDEIDNGLHHSVLESLWTWLAKVSAQRQLQIFATTHSEECIQAACRAFTAANDDGLRVIRLDRRGEDTVATVYDRALVEAATQMDVEIRG